MGHDAPMDHIFLDVVDRILPLVPNARPKPGMLVVCGAADAGTSALVGALTGLPFSFPPGNSPFLVRIDYQRNQALPRAVCSTAIEPGPRRKAEDKARLVDGWPHAHVPLDQIGRVMEDAASRITAVRDAREESDGADGLRITIAGPTVPRLSIVYLPTVELLEQTVLRNPGAIMMPVVSLERPLDEQQQVLATVRRWDPQGRRSLATLTHTSTEDAKCNFNRSWKDHDDNLDFHVFCLTDRGPSPDYLVPDFTQGGFFPPTTDAASQWSDLPSGKRGIESLHKRLGEMLGVQTLDDARRILSKFELTISDLGKQLLALDVSRPVLAKRRQLTELAARFEELMAAAVVGDYDDVSFFEPPRMAKNGRDRRLAAAINSRLSNFADRMRACGPSRTVVEHGDAKEPNEISRDDYVAEVEKLIARRRSWELAGLFSPTVVMDLFRQQSRPWKGVAEAAVGDIMYMVRQTATAMIRHLNSNKDTFELEQFVMSRVANLERDLLDEVHRLLVPRLSERVLGTLTQRVKDLRAQRNTQRITDALKSTFGAWAMNERAYYSKARNYASTVTYPALMDLSARLEQTVAESLETSAASAAVDYSEEYHQVALGRFIDQVSDYAVDRCLLSKLSSVFTPLVVAELSNEAVDGMLTTSDSQRAELVRDLNNLQTSRETLNTVFRKGLPDEIYDLTNPALLVKINDPEPADLPEGAESTPNSAAPGAAPRAAPHTSGGPKDASLLRLVLSPPADAGLSTLTAPASDEWDSRDNENDQDDYGSRPKNSDKPNGSKGRRDYDVSSDEEEDDDADGEDGYADYIPGKEVPPEKPLPFLDAPTSKGSCANEVEESETHRSAVGGFSPSPQFQSGSEDRSDLTQSWDRVESTTPTGDGPSSAWALPSRPPDAWANNASGAPHTQPNMPGHKKNKPSKKTRDARKQSLAYQQRQQRQQRHHHNTPTTPPDPVVSAENSQPSFPSLSGAAATPPTSLVSPQVHHPPPLFPSPPLFSSSASANVPPVRHDVAADPQLAAKGTAHVGLSQRNNEKGTDGVVTHYLHICALSRFKRYSPEELRLVDYSLPSCGRPAPRPSATESEKEFDKYIEMTFDGYLSVYAHMAALPRFKGLSPEELRLKDYAAGRVPNSALTTASAGVARMAALARRDKGQQHDKSQGKGAESGS